MKTRCSKFTRVMLPGLMVAALLSPNSAYGQRCPGGFVLISIACGGDTTYRYRTPKGETLYLEVSVAESAERAAYYLRRRATPSELVVERGSLTDEHGESVGERVVMLYPDKAVVHRTYKRIMEKIEAPSIEGIVEYERWREEVKKRCGADM